MKYLNKYKKEEIDKIINDVDKSLKEFIRSGKYKDLLLQMGNINKYSLTNQIYILLQMPNAITVKGIREWNHLKRTIKKGENGIKIISPIKKFILKEVTNDNDEKLYKKEIVVDGYKKTYVFDISQTEGEELINFKMDESKIIENKELIIKGINEIISGEGYKLKYVSREKLEEGCLGLCNHNTKMIYLLLHLSDLQEISTLIHETAHALAHNPYSNKFKGIIKLPSRDIKEVEAESIACVVSSYLNLDTKNFNFSYISSWAEGDISKFRNNIDLISYYSGKIISSIDKYINNKEDYNNAKLGD